MKTNGKYHTLTTPCKDTALAYDGQAYEAEQAARSFCEKRILQGVLANGFTVRDLLAELTKVRDTLPHGPGQKVSWWKRLVASLSRMFQ